MLLIGKAMDKKGLISRTPLQSKKFIAAMVWNFIWLILIAYGIRSGIEVSSLNAMIYVTGASQLGYVGGQSAVDAWVKGAIAKSSNPVNEE